MRDDRTFDAVYFYDQRRIARTDYKANSPGVNCIRHVHLDDFFAASPNQIASSVRSDEASIPEPEHGLGQRADQLAGDLDDGAPAPAASGAAGPITARSLRSLIPVESTPPRHVVAARPLSTPSRELVSEAEAGKG
jgi:hypothetical protein